MKVTSSSIPSEREESAYAIPMHDLHVVERHLGTLRTEKITIKYETHYLDESAERETKLDVEGIRFLTKKLEKALYRFKYVIY